MACAFYRSGFETAIEPIVDGAGTFIPMKHILNDNDMLYELETIFTCEYPAKFTTKWKHLGANGPFMLQAPCPDMTSEKYEEEGTHIAVMDEMAGIVKAYEAVTQYCGFTAIEAGKTMGLIHGKSTIKFHYLRKARRLDKCK